MDRPPRSLTIRETVLLITHAAGDTVAGRTIMQKLAYFTGLRLSTGMGHRPHFYGPFSSKVEDAVSNAVLAGDLHETVERMPHWSGGPDLRKYTYVLTENGKRRVEDLIEHRPEQWGRVRDAVHVIKEVSQAGFRGDLIPSSSWERRVSVDVSTEQVPARAA